MKYIATLLAGKTNCSCNAGFVSRLLGRIRCPRPWLRGERACLVERHNASEWVVIRCSSNCTMSSAALAFFIGSANRFPLDRFRVMAR